MRTFQIVNIKKIEALTLSIPEGDKMLAFIGQNGTGKSTIGQVIRNLLSVNNFIKEPVTQGKETGKANYVGPDINGDEIRIEWEIGKDFESFHAYSSKDGKVKVISEPSKIRQLVGSYFSITAQEALSMMKYADTRKKFIEDYILKTLSDETYQKFQTLSNSISDKKNKATEGNLFHTRTDINKDITALQAQIKATEDLLTDQMKQDIEEEKEIQEALQELKDELETKLEATEKENFKGEIADSLAGVAEDVRMKIKRWPDLQIVIDQLSSMKTSLIESITEQTSDKYFHELRERIDNGNKLIWNISAAKESQGRKGPWEEKIKALEVALKTINEKIDKVKEERAELLAKNLAIPGLEFDEDFNIRLNGFLFDENSVSETEAKIAIVQLLSAINTADFIDIGDWSLYDKESRKKLLKIVEKNNQILIGQKVTEDTEVAMEVIMKG